MIVYLLRHGVAEDGHQGGDAARRLTAAGVEKLERAAPAWKRLIPQLDKIVHSPLVRAQQTAAILGRAIGGKPEFVVDEDLVPAAPPAAMLERLHGELLGGTEAIACVGHEPHLGGLFSLLVTGHGNSPIPLKKGMLIAIELRSASSLLGRLVFALGQKAACLL